VMLRRVIQERTDELTTLIDDGKRTGGIDPELDTLSVVRFCHAVGLGFLLFGAVDLDRPEASPWETLIERLVRAVAQPGTPAAEPDEPAPESDGTSAGPGLEDIPAGRTRTVDG
jgi:hypothetical protein